VLNRYMWSSENPNFIVQMLFHSDRFEDCLKSFWISCNSKNKWKRKNLLYIYKSWWSAALWLIRCHESTLLSTNKEFLVTFM